MFTIKQRNDRFAGRIGRGGRIQRKFDLSEKLKNRQVKGDARMQIIVQQRSKIKDARDRLNLIAKQTDAREKLQKLKFNNSESGGRVAKFVTVKQNNLKRLGNNNSQASKVLQNRTMVQIQRQLMDSERGNNVARVANFRTNPALQRRIGQRGVDRDFQPPGERKQVVMNSSGMLITTTSTRSGQFRSSLPRTQFTASNDLSSFLDDDAEDDVEMTDMSAAPLRVRSLTQRFSIPPPPPRNRLSANLQSRLNMGEITTQPQDATVTVGNLHPSVTQDDIEELFGDVGQLKRAVLSPNGIAEVVFVNAIDAQRACDTYHNRQLDGKPMSVKLSQSNSSSSVAYLPQTKRISPDAQLIRKTLFAGVRNPSTMVSPNPQFTIRMNRK